MPNVSELSGCQFFVHVPDVIVLFVSGSDLYFFTSRFTGLSDSLITISQDGGEGTGTSETQRERSDPKLN